MLTEEPRLLFMFLGQRRCGQPARGLRAALEKMAIAKD
jgi:hypothetical protein